MLEFRRRKLIALLGGAAAAWPLVARVQQTAMPVIGVLYAVSAAEWANYMAGFRRGLNEAGFVEGQNVAIEYRWAEGQFDRLPAMASDLVGRKVAVILTGGGPSAIEAAMAATKTIPIVFTTGVDPVAAGLVVSLNRPGGNVTGITSFPTELGAKRLELLRELLPTASTIGLLVNPHNQAVSSQDIATVQAAARRLALNIIVIEAGAESEIEPAFVAAVGKRTAAILIGSDALFLGLRERIAAVGIRFAIPAVATTRESVVAGSLMSYGANVPDGYRQAGIYVGRILKGEKPADLPVVQPTKFELAINLKTARALGLTVPQSLLLRADEVIQ